MPKITALDSKTNTWVEVEDELDVKTGKSLAREGLSAAKVPFKVTERLIHKKSREAVDVPEDELKEALATGEFDIEALSDAKGEGYEKAQVGKYGEVGVNEAAIRKINPVFDETEGAITSPTGALKAAAGYVGFDVDESAPDLKKYRGEVEMQRARTDRGEENYPAMTTAVSLSSGALVPNLGIINKVGKVVGKIPGLGSIGNATTLAANTAVGKVAEGAAEGLGYAVAEDEDTTLYNKGNLAGAAVGGAVPGVIEIAKGIGKGVKNWLGNKGEGRGAKYLDNPELLEENLKASEKVDDLRASARVRGQQLDEQIIPLDEQIGRIEGKVSDELAVRKTRINELDTNINQASEELGAAKIQAKEGLASFKLDKTREGREEIKGLLAKYDDELAEMGSIRDARLDELEGFGITDKARQAYINLRATLKDNLGKMYGKESDYAKDVLDDYLPEGESMDMITQGQYLKRMKRVKDEFWQQVNPGEGSGTSNFYKTRVAANIQNAWESTGQDDIIKMTKDMAPIWDNRDALRKGATKLVPGRRGANDKSGKVFAPKPLMAEKSEPETLNSLKIAGYEPKINRQMLEEQTKRQMELMKIDLRIKILRNSKDGLEKNPSKYADKLRILEDRKSALKSQADSLNSSGNAKILEQSAKSDDIDKLYGRKSGPQALAEAAVDGATMVVPAGVKQAGRSGLSALADPVRQIETYNWIREAFNKPALTAEYRALTLGGRTLTREAIKAMAEQHNVDPAEFEQKVRANGN